MMKWLRRRKYKKQREADTMFDQIQRSSVVLWQEAPIRTTAIIPYGSALVTAQKLWAMICWTYNEFVDECRKYNAVDVASPRYVDFYVHSAARTISYVIYVTLLEGIIRKMYEDMCASLHKWVDESIEVDNEQMERRKEEEREVRAFRNKVAAHTAYAYPMQDSIATQMTSLISLTSTGFDPDIGPVSFVMGAVKLVLEGEPPDTEIPRIALHSLHPGMVKHFSAWEEMFCSKLEEAQAKLPIERPGCKIRKREGQE